MEFRPESEPATENIQDSPPIDESLFDELKSSGSCSVGALCSSRSQELQLMADLTTIHEENLELKEQLEIAKEQVSQMTAILVEHTELKGILDEFSIPSERNRLDATRKALEGMKGKTGFRILGLNKEPCNCKSKIDQLADENITLMQANQDLIQELAAARKELDNSTLRQLELTDQGDHYEDMLDSAAADSANLHQLIDVCSDLSNLSNRLSTAQLYEQSNRILDRHSASELVKQTILPLVEWITMLLTRDGCIMGVAWNQCKVKLASRQGYNLDHVISEMITSIHESVCSCNCEFKDLTGAGPRQKGTLLDECMECKRLAKELADIQEGQLQRAQPNDTTYQSLNSHLRYQWNDPSIAGIDHSISASIEDYQTPREGLEHTGSMHEMGRTLGNDGGSGCDASPDSTELEQEATMLREKVYNLTTQLEHLNAPGTECDELKAQLEDLKVQLEALSQACPACQGLKVQLQDLARPCDTCEDLKVQLQALAQPCAACEDLKARLEDLARPCDTCEDLKVQLQALAQPCAACEDLKAQLRDLSRPCDTCEELKARLEDLARPCDTCEELKARLEDLARPCDTCEDLKAQLQELARPCDTCENLKIQLQALAQSCTECEELKAQLEYLKAACAECEDLKAQLEYLKEPCAECEDLKVQLEASRQPCATCEDLKAQLHSVDRPCAVCEDLRTQLRAFKSGVDALDSDGGPVTIYCEACRIELDNVNDTSEYSRIPRFDTKSDVTEELEHNELEVDTSSKHLSSGVKPMFLSNKRTNSTGARSTISDSLSKEQLAVSPNSSASCCEVLEKNELSQPKMQTPEQSSDHVPAEAFKNGLFSSNNQQGTHPCPVTVGCQDCKLYFSHISSVIAAGNSPSEYRCEEPLSAQRCLDLLDSEILTLIQSIQSLGAQICKLPDQKPSSGTESSIAKPSSSPSVFSSLLRVEATPTDRSSGLPAVRATVTELFAKIESVAKHINLTERQLADTSAKLAALSSVSESKQISLRSQLDSANHTIFQLNQALQKAEIDANNAVSKLDSYEARSSEKIQSAIAGIERDLSTRFTTALQEYEHKLEHMSSLLDSLNSSLTSHVAPDMSLKSIDMNDRQLLRLNEDNKKLSAELCIAQEHIRKLSAVQSERSTPRKLVGWIPFG